jgi:hypothetical protein
LDHFLDLPVEKVTDGNSIAIASSHHSRSTNSIAIMLQRTLLRSSRSLQTKLPHRTLTTSIRSSPFIRPAVIYPSSTRVAARWYSDAKQEAKQAEGEKIQEDEVLKSSTNTSSEAGAEIEKLKKELEAKTKEAQNLKVLPPLPF